MTTTTIKTSRIGPKMYQALSYIAEHPGCAMLPVAEHVGPRGSRMYGYRTTHRCLAAGLIESRGTSQWRYSLHLTEAGRAALGAL